jgi:hypothetical protein
MVDMRFERGKDPKKAMGIGVHEMARRVLKEMNRKAPFWTEIATEDGAIQTWKYDSGTSASERIASLVFTEEAEKWPKGYCWKGLDSEDTSFPEYRILDRQHEKTTLITLEYWLNVKDLLS